MENLQARPMKDVDYMGRQMSALDAVAGLLQHFVGTTEG